MSSLVAWTKARRGAWKRTGLACHSIAEGLDALQQRGHLLGFSGLVKVLPRGVRPDEARGSRVFRVCAGRLLSRPATRPTAAAPGTQAKFELLASRAARGDNLDHPADARRDLS
jgi:hypothetical protein